jgi:hypothetical protein
MNQSRALEIYLHLWILRGRLRNNTGPVDRQDLQEYQVGLERLTEASGCDFAHFRILAGELPATAQTPLVCRSVPLSQLAGPGSERGIIVARLNDLLRSFTISIRMVESVRFHPRPQSGRHSPAPPLP